MAYDTTRDRTVLLEEVGGISAPATRMWHWDGTSWSLSATPGPAVNLSPLVHDPLRDALVIHGDFERGFIRAEIFSVDDLVEHGSEAEIKSAGKLRVEGKEYVMQEKDVVHFLFNV